MMKKQTRTRLGMALWAGLMALATVVSPYGAPQASAETNAAVPEPSDEIVYIDSTGFIRVIDMRYDGVPQVQWVSELNGWDEIALGDVNNDGDQEIIAIRGDGTEAKPGIVAIFDPVLASGVPDGKIGGIPWAKLFELNLGYKPMLVAAGNFDAGIPGDQILVGGLSTDPSDSKKVYKVTIFKQTTTTPDGRTWMEHQVRYFEEQWTRASAGDMIVGGTDELALVAEESDLPSSGKFALFHLDNNWNKIWNFGDKSRPANDAIFGQWKGSQSEELAVTRDPNTGQTSLFVGEWSENDRKLVEDTALVYYPAARRLAFGNTNGRGNAELFLLRTVPAGTDLPRLFNVVRGDDSGNVHMWNEKLSDDNGWRAIVMGDTDGDGRDELVIGRNDTIRVYTNPSNGPDEKVDIPVTFNRRSLVIGDLDKNGFIEGPQFEVDKTEIVAATPSGTTVQDVLRLRNSATAEAVNFSIIADGSPAWMNISPASGNLPANGVAQAINLTFNATGLEPGVYRSRLTISSSANVNNAPISLVVTFTVQPALLTATPGSFFITLPITPTEQPTQTREIRLTGTNGTRFTAAVISAPDVAAVSAALGGAIVASDLTDEGVLRLTNASGATADVALQRIAPSATLTDTAWPSGLPWVSVTSNGTTVPATLKVTFDPAQLVGDFDSGMLILFPDDSAGTPPESLKLVPLIMMRPLGMQFAPFVAKP